MGSSEADESAVLAALEDRRAVVNDAIEEDLPIETPERLYDASRYLLDAGGKRLRPTITLLVGEAVAGVDPGSADYRRFPTLDGNEIDLMKAAMSIEVIQSFTLIHDDIMDDDELRRGVPAVHEQFDLETAILAGDTLYSKAFEIMLETGATPERAIDALQLLAETCTLICEGQALDIAFEDDPDVTIDAYRDMIERKTAVLFRAAAAVPGILMGADDDTIEALGEYGLTVGHAFQIHDDVLDLVTPSDQLGKIQGSDLVEGKRTLITLHAERAGVDVDAVRPTNGDPESIETAVDAFQRSGSIEYASEEAHRLVEDGVDRLDVLDPNRARDLLTGLAYYLVEREY